jgi:uncharacterized protein YqjF (DUF2071 family)
MSFLKAEWRKLAIANYTINPKLLEKYLPFGAELDLYNGQCYISLVGFMFCNTQLLGIKIPYHINFEEVNLRFYVKRKDNELIKRGVVFIKEIVPKSALTLIANTFYNEHYVTLPMKHNWEGDGSNSIVNYQWKKSEKWNSFTVNASTKTSEIEIGSVTEFITEHYWGYARVNSKKTNEYEVTHPRWKKHYVSDYQIDVDFGDVYGDEFSFLTAENPVSVMLAEGSNITFENKTTIKR